MRELDISRIHDNTIGKMNTVLDTPTALRTGFLSGEAHLLTCEGDLVAVEDVASQYQGQLDVLCFDTHGRVAAGVVHSFYLAEDVVPSVTVVLASGMKLKVPATQKFLTIGGDWLDAGTLGFGTVLRGAVYNSHFRNPSVITDEVVHTYVERAESQVPMFGFSATPHGNLLVGSESPAGVSLVAVTGGKA